MEFSRLGRILACGTAMALAALPASAQNVKLRYSNWLPASYFINADLVFPWFEEVARVTEGRVTIEPTPKVIGATAAQFDVLRDGLADMAFVVPGYTPGRFPLIEGLELPFYGDRPETRSPATWRVYEKHIAPLDIFKGVHVLTLFTGTPAQMFTASAPIDTVAGFNGAKVRSPQPATTEMLSLLGAVPIVKPVPEIYELASGGVIDGGIIPPDVITGFKLESVLKQHSYYAGGLANTVNMIAINNDAWERISEQDRAAITAISGEVLAEKSGEAHRKSLERALAGLEASGVTRVDVPLEVVDEVKKIIAPVEAVWIERAVAAGLSDPRAMLDDLKAQAAP